MTEPKAIHSNPIVQAWLDTQAWLPWLPDSCARVNAVVYIAAEAIKRGDIPDDVFRVLDAESGYYQRYRDSFGPGKDGGQVPVRRKGSPAP